MGAEMQTSLDSLVQFITAGLQLPRRSPLATLGIKARLLGQMLNDFPQRILTSRTKSEFWGKKSNEVLERMLLSDPSAAPNWPRVRYSPLLSVAKAWTALSDENEEEGEIVIVNLFEKILDIAANSASVELYLSLLVAIEECPLPARVLPLWAALASSFAQQVEGTDDVFADDGTFYEALATLLVPLRHPTSFSEARAEAWKLFWDAFWDSARIKLKTPSVVLEQLLEKVVSLDIKSAESFGWISFCYRTLLSTAKDVAGLLASSRKRRCVNLWFPPSSDMLT